MNNESLENINITPEIPKENNNIVIKYRKKRPQIHDFFKYKNKSSKNLLETTHPNISQNKTPQNRDPSQNRDSSQIRDHREK